MSITRYYREQAEKMVDGGTRETVVRLQAENLALLDTMRKIEHLSEGSFENCGKEVPFDCLRRIYKIASSVRGMV